MPSETHKFLVNGWKYMKENEHAKGKLIENETGAICIYGGLLVGNGIATSECRDFYPPFKEELEKFNGAAKLLQEFTPEGGNVPRFNDLDWVPKEFVVAIFELAIKKIEKLENIPPYMSALRETGPGAEIEDWMPKPPEMVIPVTNYGAMNSGTTYAEIAEPS